MRSSMPFPIGERLFSVPFNKKSPIENRAAAAPPEVGSPHGRWGAPTGNARAAWRANFAGVMRVRNARAPWPCVMAVGRDVPIAPPG